MDLPLSILCVTIIHLSYGETEPEITKGRALVDSFGERSHSHMQDEIVNFTHKVDPCKGTVAARFHISQKIYNYTKYEIKLQIFEDINNETCWGNVSNEKKHSERVLHSAEVGEVVFRHVFSGCYRWEIKPSTKSASYREFYTDLVYIVTNVPKRKIAKEDVKILNPTHNCKNSSLDVKIIRNFTSDKTIITLATLPHQHIPTKNSCGSHATDHSDCVVFLNGTSTCKSNNNFTSPECKKLSDKKDADSMCPTDESEWIRCTFFNVTPGNYCVMTHEEDDRCENNSIFECDDPCAWSINEKVEDCFDDIPEVNLNSVSSFALSLVVIITLILLFFIGVIVYMFKRRPPMIPSLDEPKDETLPMIIKKKVLLLYARDCKQFMTVMKSFGQLLEKSHNVEVFDCYYDEDVLDGPLDWLQNKLRNPQFYVLIVTSHCAYLHQEAILAGDWGDSYSFYREPSFLDRVFIYGLKWVMKDISANPFSKNYIIGFRGFSEDEEILSLPTNWRRYIIPDHLDKLLTDMDIYCSPENIKNTVQHVSLESDINSLCRYKSENPHYLNGILAI